MYRSKKKWNIIALSFFYYYLRFTNKIW